MVEPTEGPAEKNFSLNPVIFTPKNIDEYRLKYGNDAGEVIAKDLVQEFAAVDYAEQMAADPNFLTYDGLRDGTAGILRIARPDARAGENALNDDSIIELFSNATKGSFVRTGLGEFVKTAPSITAGIEVGKLVGSQVWKPPVYKGPFKKQVIPLEVAGRFIAPFAAGAVSSFLLYEGADKLEEVVMGPDEVITPGIKRWHETLRTAAGMSGGLHFPYLFKQVNSGAGEIIKNLAKDMEPSRSLKFMESVDNYVSGIDSLAKAFPKATILGEIAAGAGATIGAFTSESVNPGGTFSRLSFELLGAGSLYATFAKTIPKILKEAGSDGTALLDKGQKLKYQNLRNIYDQAPRVESEVVGRKIAEAELKLGRELTPAERTKFAADSDFQSMENQISDEINALYADAFPGVEFSAGQRTGDIVLNAIEARKAIDNPTIDNARKLATSKATVLTLKFIEVLKKDGSEEAVQQATRLRRSLYTDLMKARLVNAVETLNTARNNFSKQQGVASTLTKDEMSEKLVQLFKNQIGLATREESAFWNKIDGKLVVLTPEGAKQEVPNFIKMWDTLDSKNPDTEAVLGIKFVNESSQKAFEKEVSEITKFVDDAKATLGLAPDETVSTATLNPTIQKLFDSYPGTQKFSEGLDINLRTLSAEDKVENLRTTLNTLEASKKITPPNRRKIAVVKDKIQTISRSIRSQEQQQMEMFNESGSSIVKEASGITAKQLIEIRGRALKLATNFSSGSNKSGSVENDYGRRIGVWANSVLDDLDTMKTGGEAYNDARSFSFAKNNMFARSAAGDGVQTTGSGAAQIPPEVWLGGLLGSRNSSLTLSRVRDLEQAAKWADSRGYGAGSLSELDTPPTEVVTGNVFSTMDDLTTGYLRNMKSAEVFSVKTDPITNDDVINVNADALTAWREDNKNLLKMFPALDADTKNAVRAQNLYKISLKRYKENLKTSNKQKYIATLLNGSSPTVAITKAFEDAENPTRELRKIFAIAREGNTPSWIKSFVADQQALGRPTKDISREGVDVEVVRDGLRTAIMQKALLASGGESAVLNTSEELVAGLDPRTLYRTLFGALDDVSKKSMMDLALDSSIVGKNDYKRLKMMTTKLVQLQAYDLAGRLDDPALRDQYGLLLDFYVGIAGSAAGTRSMSLLTDGKSGPGAIKAASAGSNLLTNLLLKIPASKKVDLYEAVLLDPELTVSMMRRPQNERDANRSAQALFKALVKKGFGLSRDLSPAILRETAEDSDGKESLLFPENEERNIEYYKSISPPNRDFKQKMQQLAPLETSFLQRPSDGNPPTTPTGPASGPSTSSTGTRFSAMSQGEKYAALFPNDASGIGSLMS